LGRVKKTLARGRKGNLGPQNNDQKMKQEEKGEAGPGKFPH